MTVDQGNLSTSSNWTASFIEYLARGNLPNDVAEAQRMARRCKSFMIIGDTLYKRNTSGTMTAQAKVQSGKRHDLITLGGSGSMTLSRP
jgi:hypothetical protein